MHRLTFRVGIALTCVLALLVLLGGWLGDQWLESAGGRRLLQHELSQAIGRPVHLAGDYRMRLLPRVAIAGEDLEIGLRDGGAPVTVGTFRATVGLLPLLRRRLRIDSIELTRGQVDLARLDRLGMAGTAGVPVSVPVVAAFELREFQLLMPNSDTQVRLDRLELVGFRPNSPTPLAIEAALVEHGQPFFTARLAGLLLLAADASSARLELESLSVGVPEGKSFALRGIVEWRGGDKVVHAELRHDGPSQSLSLDVEARVGGPMSGLARARYEGASPARSASAEIRFERQAADFRLDAITVDIDGQRLAGRGCVLVGERPTVAASLAAAELDLDLLGAWLAKPGEAGTMTGDLPFDPAIAIDVAQATLSGATAHGVRVRVGPEPACPGQAPAG